MTNPGKFRSQRFVNIRKYINVIHQIKKPSEKNQISINKDGKTKVFDKLKGLSLIFKFLSKLGRELYFLKMM